MALAFSVLQAIVPGTVFAYRVEGVVEFSYTENQTKVGTIQSNYNAWSQTYRAGFSDYFLDPRAINYNAAIGYTAITVNSGQDSRSLDYSLDAIFFPGMRVSGDAYARNSATTVHSDSNIAGYEFHAKSYGATMNIALNKGGMATSNNNNYSNNNNSNIASGPKHFVSLPNISLSRTHTDNNSLNPVNPLNETLDVTRASAISQINSLGDISFDGQQEEYSNLTTHSSYDTKTANISSNLELSSAATAAIVGRYTERTTDNIAGFASWDKTSHVNTRLDFKEKDRFKHNYQYSLTKQNSTGLDATGHSLSAGANYSVSDAISTQGLLNFTTVDYVSKSTTTSAKNAADSSTANVGINYQKVHTPAFLNPFAANTHYGLTMGYVSYSGVTVNGSGFLYGNDVGVGLMSTGWQLENLTLDMSYQNTQDLSPTHHNTDIQSYRLNFISRRVDRTTIRASITYTEQYIRSAVTLTQISAAQASNQNMRSMLYDINADHAATNHLNITAGASRGEIKSSQFSISNLQGATSTSSTIDDQLYLAVTFNYPLSRYLNYNAIARSEYHHTQLTRTQVEDLSMRLDYRIRMVFVSGEARLRVETPSGSPRSEQQHYFVKLTRPF